MTEDAGSALKTLLPYLKADARTTWNSHVARLKAAHPPVLPPESDCRHPLSLLDGISRCVDPQAIITTDVGQHQMWVAQAYPFRYPRSFLTSGGLGTMGFGVPAAIGAALANPGRQVVTISGDGSFLMNIQELATLAEQQLELKVIVMNNNHLGLVRQQQELFYGGRLFASRFELSPNFAAIAEGFGIRGYDLGGEGDPQEILTAALTSPGPAVINAPINFEANVYPMVPPGAANREMIGGERYA